MKRTVLWIMLLYMLSASSLLVADAIGATDKPLTNPDIIKMIKAELGEETIVQAIQNGPSDFDTSTDALILLKKEGASQKILNAILAAKTPKSPYTPKSGYHMVNPALSWNDVFLIDGNTRTQLKRVAGQYIIKSVFFRTINWHVLSGSHADVQIMNSTPAFEFALPMDVKAADMVKIEKPDVKPDSREIETAMGGLFVNKNSLNKRILPVVIEELKGEDMLGGRFAKYRVKPASPLPPGEYLLSILGMYYDFGVETAK